MCEDAVARRQPLDAVSLQQRTTNNERGALLSNANQKKFSSSRSASWSNPDEQLVFECRIRRPGFGRHIGGIQCRNQPVGSYNYTDSFGDSESLTISTGGTLTFGSGCLGLWAVSGKSIAMDLNQNGPPACTEWVFVGTLYAHGIKKGVIQTASQGSGHWSAKKT
jgi:hypothetical protein